MRSGTQERRPTLTISRGLCSREVNLPAGPFEIMDLVEDRRQCFGLLLTHGLITGQLEAGRAKVAWLLGRGDLIRPWEMADIPLGQATAWRALTDARLLRIARNDDLEHEPDAETIEKLLRAASRTSHWLLATSLIMSSPSITERLLLLFALYGERWGKMTTDGVRIKLPLTHELLGRLCGARRPTVSLAIKSLEEDGFITRVSPDVWLLHQHPALIEVRSGLVPYESVTSVDGHEAAPPAGGIVST